MNQQVKQKMYLAAITEMQKKVESYKNKPDANMTYVIKQESYIDAIVNYVQSLEAAIQNERFNKDVLVTTVVGTQNGLVPVLRKEIEDLKMLLKLRGIDEHDQAYLLTDVKEIKRAISINEAQKTWSELY